MRLIQEPNQHPGQPTTIFPKSRHTKYEHPMIPLRYITTASLNDEEEGGIEKSREAPVGKAKIQSADNENNLDNTDMERPGLEDDIFLRHQTTISSGSMFNSL